MIKSEPIPEFVSDLMTEDLMTVRTSDQVGRARDLMIGVHLNALPVVERGSVVGIITATDLVDDWPDHTPVADVMRSSPIRIDQGATIVEAAQKMLSRHVHHLIVDGGGTTVGILSSFDLLRALLPHDGRSSG